MDGGIRVHRVARGWVIIAAPAAPPAGMVASHDLPVIGVPVQSAALKVSTRAVDRPMPKGIPSQRCHRSSGAANAGLLAVATRNLAPDPREDTGELPRGEGDIVADC
jgi:phosphoribosylcarboxyaminoimidazole (NCAIR) mutase